MLTLRKGSVSKVRYVIRFAKEKDIKFISHLDLMRTIHRVIRRAGLPVEYSKGFNPHMNVSIAQPLSVGVYSKGEYLDIVLTEEVAEDLIINKLNNSAPPAIKFLQAIKVPESLPDGKKIPQVAAILEGALYKIKINYDDVELGYKDIESLLKKEEWTTIKKGKKGEKEVNIKSMVKEFKFNLEGNSIEIEALLACGSKENLSPDLLNSYIKANTRAVKENSFVEVERQEMYTLKEGRYVSIASYFQ